MSAKIDYAFNELKEKKPELLKDAVRRVLELTYVCDSDDQDYYKECYEKWCENGCPTTDGRTASFPGDLVSAVIECRVLMALDANYFPMVGNSSLKEEIEIIETAGDAYTQIEEDFFEEWLSSFLAQKGGAI